MKKRLMITGGGGFVAGSVIWHATDDWDVHAVELAQAPYQRKGVTWHTLDLRDTARLAAVFDEVKPDAVIHTAAMADIDYCEANKDVAEAVNVGVTRELARLCGKKGPRMILLSTDTVFDGKKGLYSEVDIPNPLNFYGETKAKAENAARAATSNWVISRLSLVMGLPVLGAGNSFVARMIEAMDKGQEVGFPDEEIRTPVDVITLGRALVELAGMDFIGYMHLAGSDRLSRFGMAQRLAERLGYSRNLVIVKNPSQIPGRAPRPRDASLNNAKARATLKTPMRTLDGAIDLMLEFRKGAAS